MAKILVVEDDAMNAKLFSLILTRKAGHEVIIAEDAEDAVRYSISGEIDLIIMDISLQDWFIKDREVNGIDLTKIIKHDERSKDIPVLLATAHAMKGDKRSFMKESGADDYFSKPVRDHDLFVAKVQNLISLSQSRAV